MKNNLIGFGLSAILHLGVTAQLWFAHDEEPVIKPKETTVPLSLAMFQEPVKKVPAAVENLPKKEVKVVKKNTINEVQAKIQPQTITHIKKIKTVDTKKIVVEKNKAEKKKTVKKRVVKKKVENKRVVKKKTSKTKTIKKPRLKPPVKKQKKQPYTKQQKQLAKLLKPKAVPAKNRQLKKPAYRPAVNKQSRTDPRSSALNSANNKHAQRTTHKSSASKPKAVSVPVSARKSQSNVLNARSKTTSRFEAAYKSRLRQLIESNKKYPRRAKRRGLQGVVKVSFVIMANGMVSQIQIVKSSGSRILDDAAKNTVKKISRKLPFPKEIKKTHWQFSLPLSYRFRS